MRSIASGEDGLRPSEPIAGGAGPSQGPDQNMPPAVVQRVNALWKELGL